VKRNFAIETSLFYITNFTKKNIYLLLLASTNPAINCNLQFTSRLKTSAIDDPEHFSLSFRQSVKNQKFLNKTPDLQSFRHYGNNTSRLSVGINIFAVHLPLCCTAT